MLEADGSSPLTRGKRCPPGRWRGLSGLIPAHAGKTLSSRKVARPIRAHPRSRGENPRPAGRSPPHRGSSPLTRGKHQTDRVGVHGGGLIPAHAGKTLSSRKCPRPIRAHPRSRGENMRLRSSDPEGRGSSPLTRGKQVHAVRSRFRRGLIPAHAGKTGWQEGRRAQAWAHPRSRGENFSMDG